MKLKNGIIIGVIFLLLVAGIAKLAYDEKNISLEETLNRYTKVIETGNVDNIRLKIYYVKRSILSAMPFSSDTVIRMAKYGMSGSGSVVVSGDELKEHIDLLSRLNKDILIPAENIRGNLDARIYYQCHLVNQFQIKIQWFSFRESHCFFSSKT